MIREEKKITWEILKTAHHGSKNSTTETFLQTVYPQYAWISAGRKNRYGHPHDLTLKRLEKSGAKIYSTQDNGAVAVTVRKKLCGFTVETVELKVGIQYTFKR